MPTRIYQWLRALSPMEIFTLLMLILGIVLVIWNPPHLSGPPLR